MFVLSISMSRVFLLHREREEDGNMNMNVNENENENESGQLVGISSSISTISSPCGCLRASP